jgi:predicted Zn-dependent protease
MKPLIRFAPAGISRHLLNAASAVLLSAALLTGCATNPVTGRRELSLISEQEEIRMGTEQYPYILQMSGGEYLLDPELSRYVSEVGQKLAAVSDRPHLPYRFTIVNDSSWNAWALPGGKIAIHRGLLEAMRNESELAAVLGHEIVHSAARHSAQQIERNLWMQAGLAGLLLAVEPDAQDLVMDAGSLGAGLAQLSYSREAETEADAYGISYMVDAGYDPDGAVTLQELFAENQASAGGWLSSHPASIDRVKRNRNTARARQNQGYAGEAEYRVRTRRLQQRAPAYALYEKGLEALKKNNAQQALKFSLQARNRVPEEALFYGLSAQAYAKLGNARAALQALDQAIARNKDWFYFYLMRAQVHEKMGNLQEAKADYQSSMDRLPTREAQQKLSTL